MLLNEGRCVGDPLARYARVSPSERGRLNPVKFRDTILPLVRGRAAEGGRGSLTQNVALSNMPFSPRFVISARCTWPQPLLHCRPHRWRSQ